VLEQAEDMINETELKKKYAMIFLSSNHLIKQVALETTLFSFKISVPFEQWATVYDSEENKQLMKEEKIVCLYRGVKKEEPSSAVVIEQAEEGKSIAMFSNPEVRPLIEEAGHIYDSTVITSYLQS